MYTNIHTYTAPAAVVYRTAKIAKYSYFALFWLMFPRRDRKIFTARQYDATAAAPPGAAAVASICLAEQIFSDPSLET